MKRRNIPKVRRCCNGSIFKRGRASLKHFLKGEKNVRRTINEQ